MDATKELALAQVAQYFRALSVPMRLRILDALRQGERCVGDLAAQVGRSQANVSQHLAILANAGLLVRNARGTSAYYAIADPCTFALCELVCGQIGRRFADEASVRAMFPPAGTGLDPDAGPEDS
ncbi:MAG: winged helix-turn-helix transcriptional regulator [Zoogloeaceae bacterium]|nr:winged helix-turn-helix transcriptional regulator [Zoogloeaceae bacterium]